MSLCERCKAIPVELFQRKPQVGEKFHFGKYPGTELSYLIHDIDGEFVNCALSAPSCPLCKILLQHVRKAHSKYDGCVLRSVITSAHASDARGLVRVEKLFFEEIDANYAGFVSDMKVMNLSYPSSGAESQFTLPRCDSDVIVKQIREWIDRCTNGHSTCIPNAYARHVERMGPRPEQFTSGRQGIKWGLKMATSKSFRKNDKELLDWGWQVSKVPEPNASDQPLDVDYYPTRVLDVGIDAGNYPRLRHGKYCKNGGGYLALSHCWGSPIEHPIPRTLRANVDERFEKISMDILPKTFQDAVTLTRKLGLRYLWIDSICIVQDDYEDWRSEASRMEDVYKYAVCTIAAADSGNSSEGLFYERSYSGLHPYTLELQCPDEPDGVLRVVFPPPDTFEEELIDKSHLAARAWTLQERALSRRILHFTKEKLIWECRAGCASDTSPEEGQYGVGHYLPKLLMDELAVRHKMMPADAPSPYDKVAKTSTELKPIVWGHIGYTNTMRKDMLAKPEQDVAELWLYMVANYSRRSITMESDRFPALQGLAKEFRGLIGGRYLAGLWQNDLANGLMWTPSREMRITKPTGYMADDPLLFTESDKIRYRRQQLEDEANGVRTNSSTSLEPS